MFKNDLIFILPEFFLIVCIILLLIFSVFFSNKKTTVGYFIIHKALISNCYFLLLVYLALVLQTPEGSFGALGNFVIIDNSIIFFKVGLIVLSLIFFIILKDYTANLKYFDFEFIIITLFSIVGMLLLLHSNDMVSFYITIELQSLCFYVLVSSKQTSSFSTESGLKYFILGSFSSCLLLFGLILIYGFSGMFNFVELQLYSHFLTGGFTYNGMLVGIFLVTVALLFKIGLVPFHMWIPDVYEGAPTAITAMMSILPKVVLFFIFIKLHYLVFYAFFSVFHTFFIICAIFSIILGSVSAIYQIKIKRMLTYSMITNSGFLILVLSLGNLNSIHVGIFYLFSYLLITAGIFITILCFRERSNNFIFKNINSLVNLYEVNPALAFSFFIFLFSIAGIPPLLGFYTKFFVFLSCIKNGLFFIPILVVFLSIISIFYYIRLTKLMFFTRTRNWVFLKPPSRLMSVTLGLVLVFNLIFWLKPILFLNLIYNVSFYFYS